MKATVIVVGLCLALRLLLVGLAAPWTPAAEHALIGDSDPRGYHLLATRLIQGKGYLANEPDRPMPEGVLARSYPGEPEALWPPGYPAFLALGYTLFGIRLTPVILLQIVWATLGCYWIMHATARLWTPRAGVMAGLLYALEPVSILTSHRILSEAIFLPWLSLGVYVLARVLTAPTARARFIGLTLLAVVFGVASYTRVSAQPLFIALLVGLAVHTWLSQRSVKAAAWSALWAALVFLLVLSPWCWRNYRLFGVWAFSTSGAYNLLAGFEYRGDKDAMFHKAYLAAVSAGVDPARLNPFERARFWRETALTEWRADTSGNLRLYFKRLLVMMLTPSVSDWGRLLRLPIPQTDTANKTVAQIIREFFAKTTTPIGLIGMYSLLFTGLFYALCAWGALCLPRLSEASARAYIGIALFTAMFSILTTIVMSDARGRMPAMTLLMPVAGAALAAVWEAGTIRLCRRSR